MNKLSEIAQDVGISEEYLRNTNQWNLIEELAERIVLECIKRVNIDNSNGNNQWDKALTFASDSIKEHFGVKQ